MNLDPARRLSAGPPGPLSRYCQPELRPRLSPSHTSHGGPARELSRSRVGVRLGKGSLTVRWSDSDSWHLGHAQRDGLRILRTIVGRGPGPGRRGVRARVTRPGKPGLSRTVYGPDRSSLVARASKSDSDCSAHDDCQ